MHDYVPSYIACVMHYLSSRVYGVWRATADMSVYAVY